MFFSIKCMIANLCDFGWQWVWNNFSGSAFHAFTDRFSKLFRRIAPLEYCLKTFRLCLSLVLLHGFWRFCWLAVLLELMFGVNVISIFRLGRTGVTRPRLPKSARRGRQRKNAGQSPTAGNLHGAFYGADSAEHSAADTATGNVWRRVGRMFVTARLFFKYLWKFQRNKYFRKLRTSDTWYSGNTQGWFCFNFEIETNKSKLQRLSFRAASHLSTSHRSWAW